MDGLLLIAGTWRLSHVAKLRRSTALQTACDQPPALN